jgi:hypothetical protein
MRIHTTASICSQCIITNRSRAEWPAPIAFWIVEGQVLSENVTILAMCKELGVDVAPYWRDPDTYIVKLGVRGLGPVL